MESTSQNTNIKAIKEVRKLLMLEIIFLMKKQRELEKNSIKKKLSTLF